MGTFGHMFAAIHRAQIASDARTCDGQRGRKCGCAAWRARATTRRSCATSSSPRCSWTCTAATSPAPQPTARISSPPGPAIDRPFSASWPRCGEPRPHIYRGDCQPLRRDLADALVHLRKLRPLHNMYCGIGGSIIALVEANALNTGDRQARRRTIRRLAKLCAIAPASVWLPVGLRALAYVTEQPGAGSDPARARRRDGAGHRANPSITPLRSSKAACDSVAAKAKR